MLKSVAPDADTLSHTTLFQTHGVVVKPRTTTTLRVSIKWRSSVKRLSNPVIPDYTPKGKSAVDESDWLRPFTPCIVCNKTISKGYHGRWGENGGTCSPDCEVVQEAKPKEYPHGTLLQNP